MTRERAIQILKMNEQEKWRSGITAEEEKEAVDMAIEALKETVETYTFEQVQDLVSLNKKLSEEKPQWIPVTYRQMDDDEYCNFYKEYGEIPVEERKVFDCQMPEDGQEILISTKYEHIFLDTCVYDDGYGLEEYGDWEDVIAWMRLPEPYKRGEAE